VSSKPQTIVLSGGRIIRDVDTALGEAAQARSACTS